MPWKEVSTMSLRQEFVLLADVEVSNMSQLCQRFGLSRKTGYKWLARYRKSGSPGLEDQPRRPHDSPSRTEEAIESEVLKVRGHHPSWGGRKIRARLVTLGHPQVPSASTITQILRRHGCIDPVASAQHTPWQRFEHEAPNRLWQMDFKGHFPIETGKRCHPLTMLDDHSRFSPCVKACADEQGDTVQDAMTAVFRRYGLPDRMTMDHGAPWGSDQDHPYTPLTVWLIHLGIKVGHSRPYHPQTQGKDERFHRTLKLELLTRHSFRDLHHCQTAFDRWRDIYNLERPHEALSMATPASRYRPSHRAFPERLPPIEYSPGDIVRKVQGKGDISYRGKVILLSKAFHGYQVALRPTLNEGRFDVYFCQQKIREIDLNETIR